MTGFYEPISGAVWLRDLELLLSVDGIQNIRYYKSREFGKVLIINDELQHVEAWAPFYHEIVVHLPCAFIPNPRRALIMGGGSLFAAAEVLKYPSIECVDLVDYDMNIIHATENVYPAAREVLSDVRLRLVHQECKSYLTSTSYKYDILINDCFDLYAEDKSLEYDLFHVIYERMSPSGICSDLLYRSIYSEDHTNNALLRLGKYNKYISLLAVPEYPGIMHLLTMWGKNRRLRQDHPIRAGATQRLMLDRGMFNVYSPKFINFYLYAPPISSHIHQIKFLLNDISALSTVISSKYTCVRFH